MFMYSEIEHNWAISGYSLIHSSLEILGMQNLSLETGRQIYREAKEVSGREGVETPTHSL